MEDKHLTVGRFTQPAVARPLIELSSNIENGLSSRVLWLFPEPCYSKFDTLEPVDEDFTRALGKYALISVFNAHQIAHNRPKKNIVTKTLKQLAM